MILKYIHITIFFTTKLFRWFFFLFVYFNSIDIITYQVCAHATYCMVDFFSEMFHKIETMASSASHNLFSHLVSVCGLLCPKDPIGFLWSLLLHGSLTSVSRLSYSDSRCELRPSGHKSL